MPESIEAVIGFQSAPAALARLPFNTTPDPVVVHVPAAPLTSGACADSAVAVAPANVSNTATGPVLTVTVAVDGEPCIGMAVMVALPAPAPVTVAVWPLAAATVTAIEFDVVHEKFMFGMTVCALS
jgi:hypothetical protein